MNFTINIEDDNTENIKESVQENILKGLDAAGMQAASIAKRELQEEPSRIDTGLLRNSITWAVSGKPAAIKGYHASKGSNRYIRGKHKGERRSASAKNAGAVGVGFYTGIAPDEGKDKPYVMIGTNVEYALYVHEGTSRMKANRFLKKAIDENQAELIRIVAKELRNI